ncbi:MAG: class I SAM-dependent methyltransferase [Sandaracinaceae bacterium]
MYHEKGPTFVELMKQALSSTDDGYDLLAPKFDYTPFRTPDVVLERAVQVAGERGVSAGRGLDVCCGTGAGLRWFRSLCRDEMVGVDRSQGMLDEAERRLSEVESEVPHRLLQGDAMNMPFEDAEFDLAVCFGAFGHILEQDEPAFVAEIARVLKPGGRFVFITTEMPSMRSPQYWVARGFNGAMRVRNALIKPEFIMYYLTFLLPSVRFLLRSKGFDVEVVDGAFDAPFKEAKLVIATKWTRV